MGVILKHKLLVLKTNVTPQSTQCLPNHDLIRGYVTFGDNLLKVMM